MIRIVDGETVIVDKGIETVEALQAWANECVRREEADRKKFKPVKPIRAARFPSMTTRGISYDVIRWNGRVTCSCPGFQYRNKCKHIEAMV